MACVWAILAAALDPRAVLAEQMSYLDNGQIKIGVDLDLGGTITFLAFAADGKNLINSHDFGRQVQQSYYAGPQPFGKSQHKGWENWSWNPISTGDVYGNHSQVLHHENDGKTLHVESIPMQWALKNVPGDCTFDTWIELDGPAAKVRCRLNNKRDDKTQYPARDQELPAVYTIGELHRLFTYDGSAPFTGAPLRNMQNVGPPWASWEATENWAAIVNENDKGVGVIHPGVYRYLGGFNSKKAKGGPKDNSTGYIAPIRQEILDHNIVYEYGYTLVVGKLESIRAYAISHRSSDPRPDYRFAQDRQHWIYVNMSDTGFPLKGHLRLKPANNTAQMIGPQQWWEAKAVPRLYIRAAYRGPRGKAYLYWNTPGDKGFSASRRAEYRFVPDGNFRNYVVNLGGVPSYRGTICGLRLDPVAVGGGAGSDIAIESISWKPTKAETPTKRN